MAACLDCYFAGWGDVVTEDFCLSFSAESAVIDTTVQEASLPSGGGTCL